MLLAAATDHFYLDGGHTIDFINKSFEALDLVGWEEAAEVLPTICAASSAAPAAVRRARRGASRSTWCRC